MKSLPLLSGTSESCPLPSPSTRTPQPVCYCWVCFCCKGQIQNQTCGSLSILKLPVLILDTLLSSPNPVPAAIINLDFPFSCHNVAPWQLKTCLISSLASLYIPDSPQICSLLTTTPKKGSILWNNNYLSKIALFFFSASERIIFVWERARGHVSAATIQAQLWGGL